MPLSVINILDQYLGQGLIYLLIDTRDGQKSAALTLTLITNSSRNQDKDSVGMNISIFLFLMKNLKSSNIKCTQYNLCESELTIKR